MKKLSLKDFKTFLLHQNIEFSDCEFDYDVVIQNLNINSIKFENCIFNKDVFINSLTLNDLTIAICTSSNEIILNDVHHHPKERSPEFMSQKMGIYSNTFENLLKLEKCTFSNFHMANCTIKEFKYHSAIITSTAHINKNTFDGFSMLVEKTNDFQIVNNQFSNFSSITFIKNNNTESLPLNNLPAISHTFRLAANIVNEHLEIYNWGAKDHNDVEFLEIKFNPKSTGKISVTNLQLEEIILSGLNNSNSINISNCKLKNLKFLDLNNSATIELDNLNSINHSSALLKIHNSILGRIYFKNIDFSIFKKVEISESSISEIIPINPNWFSPEALESIIHSNRKKDSTPTERYKQIRDVFKQLKIVAEKSAEKQAYLNFRAKEFTYFYKELKSTKRWYNRDRIVLWLNQSNSFGVNWVKPIVLNLAIAFFVFNIIIAIISYYESAPFLNSFLLYIDDSPSLLNPARDLTKIFPKRDLTLAINLIDYSHRAVLSYLIFQTIIAFRKFSQ